MNVEFARRRLKQAVSPAPGTGLETKPIETDNIEALRNKMRARYIFFPGYDVNLAMKSKQAISIGYLYRSRWSKLVPTAYKGSDNSADAFLEPGEHELPLREHMMTPFSQSVYLFHNYAEQGLKVAELLFPMNFDFSTRMSEDAFSDIVKRCEQVLLPEVPHNLRLTTEDLIDHGTERIISSDLSDGEIRVAEYMLEVMLKSCNTALEYQNNILDQTEAEMVSKQQGRKTAPDSVDELFYYMSGRPTPRPDKLDYEDQKTSNETSNDLIKQLVAELRSGKVDGQSTSTSEVSELKNQVTILQEQLAGLLSALGSNAPVEVTSEILESGESISTPRKPRRSPLSGD